MTDEHTRRAVLRRGIALGAAGLGVGVVETGATKPGKQFGRVWANDELFRTNVVRTLEERPERADIIYFLTSSHP